jgi:hypothetical protein
MTYDYERETLDALISVPRQILKILPRELAKEIRHFDDWSRGRGHGDSLEASDGELIGLFLKIVEMIHENCVIPLAAESPTKGKAKEISKDF